jgi:hypothetical protein
VAQHNLYLSISANDLEDKEDDAGDSHDKQIDGDLLVVPHSHYNIIWHCPRINKVSMEINGIAIHGWRCDWCMNSLAMFAPNTTKGLAHVLRLPGNNICSCLGIIPESYLLSYRDLYHRHCVAILLNRMP